VKSLDIINLEFQGLTKKYFGKNSQKIKKNVVFNNFNFKEWPNVSII